MIKDKISINAHSSIRIETGKVIYFDPFHLKSAKNDADIIFITHDHYDHFSPDDIALARKDDTIFVAPESCAAKVTTLSDNVICLVPGEKAVIDGISVEAVPAYNEDKPFHPKANGWLGYVVDLDNSSVYVAGDTDGLACNSDILCDIALVPIGGIYTMDAVQAADFVNKLKPTFAIPTHYGDIVGDPCVAKVFSEAVDKDINVVLITR